MSYFVTGGTGFIGRFLIDRLIAREGTIHVLVRKNSVAKLDALRPRWGAEAKRVVAVAQRLETLGKEQKLQAVPVVLAELEAEVARLMAAIQAALDTH